MDRNTAAALGQNLSSAFADIGQIFDPRYRAAADQQRLTNEGLTLKNTGQGIENQYAPQVFGSQIGLNNAKTATEGTQQGLYKSQTAFQNTRNQGLGDLYKLNSQSQTNLTPLQQKIASAATTYNVDPNVALSIVGQESGFNPNTTPGTSSASGLFQFLDADRAKYGIGSGAPEDQQIDAGMRKMQENYNAAEKALGRKPTAGEAYAVYYQGIGAGPKILQNPDASFRDTLSQFGPGYADSVIKANPWLADIKTNRDFINWSEQKMGKQGFTGQPQPVDMNRAAILSSVAGGGGDPSQLVNAFAKAQGMGATDELTARQAALGQGVVMNQGEYFLPQESTAFQNRGLASAFGINEADNRSNELIASGNAQADALKAVFGLGGGTRRGDGSMLSVPKTAPNSFSDMNKVNEEAQAASFRTFGVPLDDEGAPTEDPYAPSRRAWSQSYTNARQTGMSPIEAEAAANVHHFGTDQPAINSENTFRFGFGKDPSIPAITNTEPLQLSPEFGADPNQMGSVIESIPALFGIQVQEPGIANTGAPVTGVEQPAQQNAVSPMLQRPAEQPTKTGRASDEFAMKEWTNEGVAIKEKQQKIADLERIIKSSTKALRDGYVEFQGSAESPLGLTELNDKSKRKMLDSLRKAENDLEKLKGGSDQSGQSGAVDLESRLSKYK